MKTPEVERERKRRWRQANPEKAKASVDRFYARNPNARKDKHLQKKYGLTLVDRDLIFDLQRKACAACGATSPGRRSRTGKPGDWIVDHNHKADRVRGIICHPCNVALGMVKDRIDHLEALVEYLRRSK